MRKIIISLFCLVQSMVFAEGDVIGYWTTMDDDTPQSIIGIYEHNDKYYGRLVATYNEKGKIDDTIENPVSRAEGVEGHPYYSGLDMIWNLRKEGDKFVDGKIMDPQKGRLYDVELWRDGKNLIVRGELKIFGRSIGRNQTWIPAKESHLPKGFKLPDLKTFVPKIPEVKKK